MGGLAFAEQLNILSETGVQDEQALATLEVAFKSEPLHDLTVTPPALLHVYHISVCPSANVPGALDGASTSPLLRAKNSYSLTLRICCFRI